MTTQEWDALVEAQLKLEAAAEEIVAALDVGPLGFCYQLELAAQVLSGELPSSGINVKELAEYLLRRKAAIETALRSAGRVP